MRVLLILSFAAALAACQRSDAAEHSAAIVATMKAPPTPVASPAALAAIAPTAQETGCGGGCGAEGGKCQMGPQGCTGGVAEMPTWKPLPADAAWTDLHVTGMHCGGCARRIEKRLASVDGVLGVKIDVTTAKVAIATVPGVDARAMVKSAIDTLGYHVD